jgi:hypothetical protein
MVPDRLSYSEMYFDAFKYPSEWTENFEAYEKHRPNLCSAIMQHMDYYNTRIRQIKEQTSYLSLNFFSAKDLLNNFK